MTVIAPSNFICHESENVNSSQQTTEKVVTGEIFYK